MFALFFFFLSLSLSEGAAGVAHDSPRAHTCTCEGPGASNTTKIPRENPPEREKKERKWKREREKQSAKFRAATLRAATLGAATLRAPTLRAPTLRAPHSVGSPLFQGYGPPPLWAPQRWNAGLYLIQASSGFSCRPLPSRSTLVPPTTIRHDNDLRHLRFPFWLQPPCCSIDTQLTPHQNQEKEEPSSRLPENMFRPGTLVSLPAFLCFFFFPLRHKEARDLFFCALSTKCSLLSSFSCSFFSTCFLSAFSGLSTF